MEEQWYAIVDSATGQLMSTGTVVADELPMGWIKLALNGQPDHLEMWDENTRQFIPRPALVMIDRLDDFFEYPGMHDIVGSLTQEQKDTITDAFVHIIGRARHRVFHEHVSL